MAFIAYLGTIGIMESMAATGFMGAMGIRSFGLGMQR